MEKVQDICQSSRNGSSKDSKKRQNKMWELHFCSKKVKKKTVNDNLSNQTQGWFIED